MPRNIGDIVNAAKDEIDNYPNDDFDEISEILNNAYAQIDNKITQEIAIAKDSIMQELEQYYQDNYSEIFGQQMTNELLDIISDTLSQMDKYSYNDSTVIENMVLAGKQEIFDCYLSLSKDEKLVELNAIIIDLGLNDEDYRAENWQAIQSIIANAEITIASYDSIEAVIDYDTQAVKSNINSIKTIAEELAEAKADKIAEVENYLNGLTQSDYSAENWQAIQGLIDNAKAVINGYDNIEAVTNYDAQNIEANIDSIKTIAEELVDAKVDKIAELDILIAQLSLSSEDYTAEKWQDILDIIANAKAEINACENVADVTAFGNDDVLAAISGVQTKAQAQALAQAKEDKKAELDTAILALDLNSDDYTTENWQDILDIIAGAKAEIDSKADISDINSFDRDSVLDNIDDVETKAETAVREFNQAKDTAKATIEIKKDKYNAYNYGGDNYSEILVLINQAKEEIDQVENSAEIVNILAQLDNELSTYKIIKESAGKYEKDDTAIDYEEDTDEYFSIVENTDGLDEGLRVVVTKIEITANESTISKKRLKTDEIKAFGLEIDKKDLKNQGILAKIDISLIDLNGDIVSSENFIGVYKVSFLLPQNLRDGKNIKVIYIDENDDVTEIFNTVREGNWITFETNHFSGFYLIGDESKVINLWWLIIILAVIILIEGAVIAIKKSKDKRTNSFALPLLAIIIPSGAWIIITIEIIAILALLAFLVYLFLNKSEQVKEKEIIKETTIIKEVPLPVVEEEENDSTQEENVDIKSNTKVSRDINNYSFTSRLHLNDKETDTRYNEIKNHLMSYDGVSSNISWKQETFTHKGKMVAKVRLQGKTIRVYLGLNPKDLDSKYNVEDNSNIKSHESTPTLQIVKGPQQLTHAKELIDLFMSLNDGKGQENYQETDYTLKKIKREKLVEMGLIKIQSGEFIDKANEE